MASPIVPNSPVGPSSPMRHGEFIIQFPSTMRNITGGVMGPWHAGFSVEDSYAPSLLEEFKSNKTKCFELSEIAGHFVEFRYGLFITLSLNTAEPS